MSGRYSIQTVDARAQFYIRHTGQRAVSRARHQKALS